jgi:hypothetical protein
VVWQTSRDRHAFMHGCCRTAADVLVCALFVVYYLHCINAWSGCVQLSRSGLSRAGTVLALAFALVCTRVDTCGKTWHVCWKCLSLLVLPPFVTACLLCRLSELHYVFIKSKVVNLSQQ